MMPRVVPGPRSLCALATVVLLGAVAAGQTTGPLWFDVTAEALPPTRYWTNKVEIADLNGDGRPDLLFANGGDYSTPGTPEPNQVFFNVGPGFRFSEATSRVVGDTPDLARVIKARDFNGDGLVDVVVGTTYQTQSRLFLGTGPGRLPRGHRDPPAADAAQRRRPRGRRRRSRRRPRSGAGRLGARQQHDQRRRRDPALAQRRHRTLHRRHRGADAVAEGALLLGPRSGRRRQRPRPRRAGLVQALPGQQPASGTTAPARSPTTRGRCRSTPTTTSSRRWTSTATAGSTW